MKTLGNDGYVESFHFYSDIAPLSVILSDPTQGSRFFDMVLEILASEQVKSWNATLSNHMITVAVPKSRADEMVQVLHSRFKEQECFVHQ